MFDVIKKINAQVSLIIRGRYVLPKYCKKWNREYKGISELLERLWINDL